MDGVLNRICRYMTDVNGRGEKWHFYRDQDGFLNLVADFPPCSDETDDDGRRIFGYVVTSGTTETDLIRNIVHGAARSSLGSLLDVPLLSGLGESPSLEELSLRLAAFGY